MTATTTTTATPDVRCDPRSSCEIVAVSSGDADASGWTDYVRAAPRATIFHDPAWARAVRRTFGQREWHLVARRQRRVVGVLPLVEVRSMLGGRMLVSMPYGTYGGILSDDETARDALARQAIELTRKRDARVLDLRSAAGDVPGLERVDRYDAYVRDLPLHPNELDKFLPRRARAAARQAVTREGAAVQHDQRQLELVWRLYARSMRRLASISYPLRLFRNLRDELGERLWVTTIWCRHQPVAGVISLVHGETVMPYVVGIDDRLRCYGGSNLLYFSVVERGVRAGLRHYDFGRSRRDNLGAAGFKKNQGFEPTPLGYQRYVPPGKAAPNLTPTNRKFELARRIWPRLPLSLTQYLGGWLARSLPG